MEKIKTLVTLSLLVLLLSSCYRQTTVILPQGQTLPSSDDMTAETVSSTAAESTVVSSEEATTAQPSHTPKETNPANSRPIPTQPSDETTPSSTATNPPAAATVPVEVTVPVEITVPKETTVPLETTVPIATAPETAPLPHPIYNISAHSVSAYEQTMQEEINRHRSDAGLSPFSISKKLSALAAIRAYECSIEFSHMRPDGRSWDTVLSDYGAAASTENILYASSGTAAMLLIDTCLASSKHSQALLNANYSSVGIGTFDTGRYLFVVMIFN